MWSWSGSPNGTPPEEPATFPTNRDALPLLTGISQAGSPDQLILVSQAVELQPLYKKQAKKPVLRFGDVELVGIEPATS